jgi:hypothetical protein
MSLACMNALDLCTCIHVHICMHIWHKHMEHMQNRVHANRSDLLALHICPLLHGRVCLEHTQKIHTHRIVCIHTLHVVLSPLLSGGICIEHTQTEKHKNRIVLCIHTYVACNTHICPLLNGGFCLEHTKIHTHTQDSMHTYIACSTQVCPLLSGGICLEHTQQYTHTHTHIIVCIHTLHAILTSVHF